MIELQYRVEHSGFTLDASLELPLQGITGIFGASGAGKTTLLRCVAGLEQASVGRLLVAGDTWEDTANGISLPVQQRNRVVLPAPETPKIPVMPCSGNSRFASSVNPECSTLYCSSIIAATCD